MRATAYCTLTHRRHEHGVEQNIEPPVWESSKTRERPPNLPDALVGACTKCGGSLTLEFESYGYGDYACLNCGASYDVEVEGDGVVIGPVGHFDKDSFH
jgi:hypothetical protein